MQCEVELSVRDYWMNINVLTLKKNEQKLIQKKESFEQKEFLFLK